VKILRRGIEEYRKLVKKKYSLDISYSQAEEGFRDLLSLFQVIYQPIEAFDKNDFSKYNQSGKNNEER
jgi:hypothetical protein